MVVSKYWCFLAFSSTISQVFTIFHDCLICSCCTFSPLFYFPTLSKLTYSTYSLKITWGEMNLFSLGISNRVFLILHLVVVTMVITQSLSFLLPQHKIRFFFSKHWPEAHLTFYFSLYIYITWESFIQDFPYPVTPKSD